MNWIGTTQCIFLNGLCVFQGLIVSRTSCSRRDTSKCTDQGWGPWRWRCLRKLWVFEQNTDLSGDELNEYPEIQDWAMTWMKTSEFFGCATSHRIIKFGDEQSQWSIWGDTGQDGESWRLQPWRWCFWSSWRRWWWRKPCHESKCASTMGRSWRWYDILALHTSLHTHPSSFSFLSL